MPLFSVRQLDHSPLCKGVHFEISDEGRLASLLAWTMVGRFAYVESLLRGESPDAPVVVTHAKSKVKLVLQNVAEDGLRWQRDGWVFQHISWIAALSTEGAGISISPPHIRMADKGFDALIIPLAAPNQAEPCVVICEDKATVSPRDTVRDNVFPEFKDFEAGVRDGELIEAHTVIAQRYNFENKEELIKAAHWLQDRRYRINITVKAEQVEGAPRAAIFKDYDETVTGPSVLRRQANTFLAADLRTWMDAFAARICDAIDVI